MKSQKVIALLLSTALSISTCVPLGSITALGAEAGTTAQAVEVQEEVSDSAESAEPSQEEEVSTAEETAAADEQEAASGETATEETEDTEVTEDTENVPAEVADDSNESADATETAVPAQEEETAESADNTGSQETDAAASEESAVPAEEPAKNDSAENNTVITAPAQTETVETDAQNSVDDPASVDFSNAIDIKAGESHTVNITEEGGYVLYRFVPEETAAYSFYSDENSGDPRASLYDADKSQIGTGDDEKAYSNFEIKRIFTAGETYYFEAGMFSSTGSYSVHLIKDEFYAEYATVSSRTVSLNDEVTLEVSAFSTSVLSYQWYDIDNEKKIEGATSAAYTLTAQNIGTYRCHVSDENGNYDDLYFFISIDNHINAYGIDEYGNETDWADVYVTPNGSVELNVTVSADDMTALKYEWSDEYGNLIEGAGTTSCTISNVTENRYYYFRVSDQYNNSQSVTFNVYVENNLRAYAVDESGNLSDYSYVDVSPNGSAELNVTVSADDTTALKYEWSDDYGNSIEGAGTTSCTISNVTKNGYYYFRVSDQYNNSQSVEFYIHVQNHLDAYALDKEGDQVSERTIYTELNSSANLDVIVSADDMDHLTYEWYDNNGDLVDGAESTSYTISTVKKAENYRFYVSDQYGNRASVDFRVIPVDYSHAKTINRGESAQVSVNEDSPYVFFKFTPTETAEYILYSSADDGDPYVEVFNDSLEKLFYDDDSGDNLQFRLTETFTAGTTYYIGARAYSMDSSIDYTIHLNKNLDIADAAVTGITNRTYNGKAQTQAPVVKIGSAILKAGTDYTVSYKNHINAGTATVTITGAGSYTGTKTVTFKINKAAQSITVKASAASIAVGKTATVSITGNKGTKSYKSSNTAVATVNTAGKITAKKVGTVTITATSAAAANYNAASKKVTIKVVPAATTSITAANQATGIKLTWKKVAGATGYKVYRGNTLIKTIRSGATVSCTDAKANTNGTKYIFKIIPTASTGNGLARSLTTYRVARPTVSSVKNTAAKKMTVRWKKNAKAKGYQIQYSTNKKFAKGNKTINITKAATVSRVISGLAKGKTYYVRIRTYKTVGKTKYWSAWSAAKTVKIKK